MGTTKGKPTSIRLREELHEKIKKDAEKDKRSITKQIEYIIETYYKIKESQKMNKTIGGPLCF